MNNRLACTNILLLWNSEPWIQCGCIKLYTHSWSFEGSCRIAYFRDFWQNSFERRILKILLNLYSWWTLRFLLNDFFIHQRMSVSAMILHNVIKKLIYELTKKLDIVCNLFKDFEWTEMVLREIYIVFIHKDDIIYECILYILLMYR